MADKLTQQITEALTRAAAEPLGLPLYATKVEFGLFSSNSSGKLAAQKSLNEGLLRSVGTDARTKSPRELYALTDSGWNYLLAQVNPKQVLEDFVRVLEARSGEVGELLHTARRMADSLQGLKEAVTRVLPTVVEGRVFTSKFAHSSSPASARPHPPTPSPGGRGGYDLLPLSLRERGLGGEGHAERGLGGEGHAERGLGGEGHAERGLGGEGHAERGFGGEGHAVRVMEAKDEQETHAIAILHPPETEMASDLCAAILAQLSEWSGAAGEDCPLPKLFQCLAESGPPPSIGEFHDSLRKLYDEKAIYLHPWTGPLYALPEPNYALLAGHNIAYYASIPASSSVLRPLSFEKTSI